MREVLRLLGRDESLITYVADRPGHDRRYAIRYDKAERELGWRPRRTFEEGLRETVEWYRANERWWDATARRAYDESRARIEGWRRRESERSGPAVSSPAGRAP